MSTREQFEFGEWYHCFNRGVDKRKVFLSKIDYERFMVLLYAGNSSQVVHISNLKKHSPRDIIKDNILERKQPLVEIAAYCLMPNHFHLVLKEIKQGGISLFMQKIITGYTMYFNKKNERTGALFSSTFKSKHVSDDRYLKHLISYVHMNPVELFEPRWKEGQGNINTIKNQLLTYPYASTVDFLNKNSTRPEKNIISDSINMLFDEPISIEAILEEAKSYYLENIKV